MKRRLNTVARGFTDRGDPVQVVGTEVLARCLQHYTDHLDGALFTGRMDAVMRKLAMREIRGSEDMQSKMSRDRKTSRILSHLARATALPHASPEAAGNWAEVWI